MFLFFIIITSSLSSLSSASSTCCNATLTALRSAHFPLRADFLSPLARWCGKKKREKLSSQPIPSEPCTEHTDKAPAPSHQAVLVTGGEWGDCWGPSGGMGNLGGIGAELNGKRGCCVCSICSVCSVCCVYFAFAVVMPLCGDRFVRDLVNGCELLEVW